MFYFENRENETIVNEMEFRVNEDELIFVKISKMSLSFFYRKRKRIFFVVRLDKAFRIRRLNE